MGKLDGKTFAILVTHGFEEVELTEPMEAIEREGGNAMIVSPQRDRVRSWDKKDWGREIDVDTPLSSVDPARYDGLLLPGGVMSPDKLRMDDQAVRFVRHFFDENKPVAAICHGPWTLIEAGAVKGRTMTSYPSLRSDLVNAGARWVDREVVQDKGLVTSRKPGDLPAFCDAMVEAFAGGVTTP